jgi:predicted dehydrogenase
VVDELGVPRAFADARELLALPELDAVVITTPTSTHHGLVIAAAGAGKAIFCEKPLALTLEETHNDVTPYLMERFGDAYSAQLQHFVDCLNSGQSPSVGAADALAACEIGIAATQAYHSGRPVILSELQPSSGGSKVND